MLGREGLGTRLGYKHTYTYSHITHNTHTHTKHPQYTQNTPSHTHPHTNTQHTHPYHTPTWAPRSVPPYCSDIGLFLRSWEGLVGIATGHPALKYPPPYIHTMWDDTVMQQVIYVTMGPNDVHCLVCNHGNCDTVELLQCKLRIG